MIPLTSFARLKNKEGLDGDRTLSLGGMTCGVCAGFYGDLCSLKAESSDYFWFGDC